MRKFLHLVLLTLGHRSFWLARKLDPAGRAAREELAERRVAVWYRDPRHVTRLTDFDLPAGAVAFDVGGFKGDWALEMLAKHDCRIEVFEPVPEFVDQIKRRLAFSDSVVVHPFGLAGGDGLVKIAVAGERSSVAYLPAATSGTLEIQLRDVADYFDERDLEWVDVVKLNIEGAEYDLLERMLERGLARRIGYLLVQFHDEFPGAAERASRISGQLDATHVLQWRVPFVWECWAPRRISEAGV